MKTRARFFWIGIFIFILFILYAWSQGVQEYIADSVVFIVLLSIAYKWYEKLNLNGFTYISLIIAFASHNAGAFGWYNISPLPLPWDHITHIVGIFAVTLVIHGWLIKALNNKQKRAIFIMTFLAAMGVGAIVELYEFAGYLSMGEGEGGLGKGAGDVTGTWISADWLNTMWDLVYNVFGAIIGLVIGPLIVKKRSI